MAAGGSALAGWLVMTGAFLCQVPGTAFLFISDQRGNEKKARGRWASRGWSVAGYVREGAVAGLASQFTVSSSAPARLWRV